MNAQFSVCYCRALQKKKEAEKEALTQRRLEAQEEVSVMAAAVEQSMASEERKSGLLIVKALYGRLQTDRYSFTECFHLTNSPKPLTAGKESYWAGQ